MNILTTEAVQKLAEYKSQFLAVFPNVEKKEDGETNKYTDLQWYNEVVKRFLVRKLKKGASIYRESLIDKTDFNDEFSE